MLRIRAIKFEEMTVTFHPSNPSSPIIINTEKKQLFNGMIIHKIFLKINQSVATINKNTPAPKTIISFFINVIMSSTIIGIPPK